MDPGSAGRAGAPSWRRVGARTRTGAWLLLLGSACGLGAAEGGGSENLPTAGLGPYRKVTAPDEPTPATEPYVLSELTADVGDPTALPLGGGGFRLWYTRTPRREDAGEPGIYLSDLPSLHDLPAGDPLLVLAADEAWEQGVVRAPSALWLGGADVVLFYQGGDAEPKIAFGISADGGLSFRKSAPLFTGRDPAAVVTASGEVLVYHTRPDRSGVFVASLASLDVPEAVVLDEPVLDRRAGSEDAFDRLWVGEPAVAGGVSATGDPWFALFYVGESAEGRFAIGAAASRDGVRFERAAGGEPILEPLERDERAPAALLGDTPAVLFFGQKLTNAGAIAAATCP